MEGKYSIHSGAAVVAASLYNPISYTQFTGTQVAGKIDDDTDAAAVCHDVDSGTPSVIVSGVITNVYYNDFVGKANIFCPRDKFNVVTCDGARSFSRISQPVVAGASQSSPSYY